MYVFQYFNSSIIINLNLFLFNDVPESDWCQKYIIHLFSLHFCRSISFVALYVRLKIAMRNGDFIFEYIAKYTYFFISYFIQTATAYWLLPWLEDSNRLHGMSNRVFTLSINGKIVIARPKYWPQCKVSTQASEWSSLIIISICWWWKMLKIR